MTKTCRWCPRHCDDLPEKRFCRAREPARCFRHRIEYGEEPELVPSHLFYMSGCNLRCVFCIGEEKAFDTTVGVPLTPEFFRAAVDWGRERGAKNVQWVGGEPTVHLDAILDVMQSCDSLPPIVWKSNFYFTETTHKWLDPVVDCFVADLKFGNETCAAALCGVQNYVETATARLKQVYDERPGDLIVRHLLLPGHFDCCFVPLLDWFAQNMPGVKLSLRDGYLPAWQAKNDPVLGRLISPAVVDHARQLIAERGLHVI
ncbi:MAG: radical SAM protein [Planctomycetaceae bacterium]|nr:radical SAM protein [Planctomycetaceae bacterium]